ncbi:nucleoid DNA-binding protein [Bradyrhizobium algeriense]|uniref:Viral histone-like protein n=1 Tax=Bradyrhizobium algeriense TaxID=634784 RepID=A0ABU8BIB8_9BRAD
MAKMTKNQLIDAIAEGTQVSKGDVKAVIEQMATVGYKELNESGEFVIPGFVKMSVVNKPATEARSGVNPFTKEPMEFAAKPASKSVKASPLLKTRFEPGGSVGAYPFAGTVVTSITPWTGTSTRTLCAPRRNL